MWGIGASCKFTTFNLYKSCCAVAQHPSPCALTIYHANTRFSPQAPLKSCEMRFTQLRFELTCVCSTAASPIDSDTLRHSLNFPAHLRGHEAHGVDVGGTVRHQRTWVSSHHTKTLRGQEVDNIFRCRSTRPSPTAFDRTLKPFRNQQTAFCRTRTLSLIQKKSISFHLPPLWCCFTLLKR